MMRGMALALWVLAQLPGAAVASTTEAVQSAIRTLKNARPYCSADSARDVEALRRTCTGASAGIADCFDALAPARGQFRPGDRLKGEPVQYPGGQAPVKELVNEALDVLNRTATTLGQPGLGGAVDNLLPGSLLSYLQHVGEELDDPQSLGLSWSSEKLGWFSVRLSGFATPEPEINPLLERRLAADGNSDRFAERVEGLDITDDYFFSAEVSLLTPWTGRHPASYVQTHINLSNNFFLPEYDHAQALAELIGVLDTESTLDDPATAEAVACAGRAAQEYWGTLVARQKTGYLGGFHRLVHNQPQLTFRYRQLHRNAIVGADSRSYRLWFGSGIGNNLSWLRLFGDCGDNARQAGCHRDYSAMADSWLMRHGVGFSGYFERGDLLDLVLQLPPPAVGDGGDGGLLGLPLPGGGGPPAGNQSFTIEGGDYRRFGWAMGATLRYPQGERGGDNGYSLRVDSGADYFRYDAGNARLDHEVYRLTFTYKMRGISVPFHAMYRTRTEFTAESGLFDDVVVGIGAGLGF
jgi:hypothetical protein